MANIHIAREIDAPPERVWRYLADAKRWPDWMPGVTSSEVTNGRPEGAGRRQHLDLAYAGRRAEIDLEITEWEPPRRIGWIHLSERIQGVGQKLARDIRTSITLTPAVGGTHISFEGSWEPVGLMGKMLGKTLVQSRAEAIFEGAAERLERLARGDETPPT